MEQSPDHYRIGNIQPWDFIRDHGLNFHLGNAIKYICRAGHKGNRADDLRKAIHYLENELWHETSRGISSPLQYTEQWTESSVEEPQFDR